MIWTLNYNIIKNSKVHYSFPILLILLCTFILSGCALPSHIHSPAKYEAMKTAKEELKKLNENSVESQIAQRDRELEKNYVLVPLQLSDNGIRTFVQGIVRGKNFKRNFDLAIRSLSDEEQFVQFDFCFNQDTSSKGDLKEQKKILEKEIEQLTLKIKKAAKIRKDFEKAKEAFLNTITIATSVPATEFKITKLEEEIPAIDKEISELEQATKNNPEDSQKKEELDNKIQELKDKKKELSDVKTKSIPDNINAGIQSIKSRDLQSGLQSLGEGFSPIIKFWTSLSDATSGASVAGFIDTKEGLLRYNQFLLAKVNYDLELINAKLSVLNECKAVAEVEHAVNIATDHRQSELIGAMEFYPPNEIVRERLFNLKQNSNTLKKQDDEITLFESFILPSLYMTVIYPAQKDALFRKKIMIQKRYKNANNTIQLKYQRRLIEVAVNTLESYEAGGLSSEQIGNLINFLVGSGIITAISLK